MPRESAIIFRDLVGKLGVLRIECDKCGRAGLSTTRTTGELWASARHSTSTRPENRSGELDGPDVSRHPPNQKRMQIRS